MSVETHGELKLRRSAPRLWWLVPAGLLALCAAAIFLGLLFGMGVFD